MINVFTLFVLISTYAHAVNLDGSYPDDPQSESSAMRRAATFDPMGESKGTPLVADQSFEGKRYKPIRLLGGLQLHPSCELEASRLGIRPDKFKSHMDKLMQRMIDRVVKCIQNYPEIKVMLQESIAQYRRQIIQCEPPKELKGLVEPRSDLLRYGAYHNEENIVLSNIVFKGLTTENIGNETESVSTMFHELLHGTSCDNRHDHNEIQLKSANHWVGKTACDENISMDRVSVIESLCMGDEISNSSSTAPYILGFRMNQCGTDRGCKNVFTDDSQNKSNKWAKSSTSGLDDTSATRLCQRIKDDGMCLHFRQTQGPFMTKMNKKKIAATKRIESLFNQFMPKQSNQIPLKFMAFHPELQSRYDSIKDDPCFKRNFSTSESQPHLLTAAHVENMKMSLNDFGEKDDLIIQFIKIKKGFAGKVVSDNCAQVDKETNQLMSDFTKKFEHNPLMNQIQILLNGIKYDEFVQPKDRVALNSELANIIGKDLLRDYYKIMDDHHHKSPTFDCMASGLSPFRTMEASLKPDACEQ